MRLQQIADAAAVLGYNWLAVEPDGQLIIFQNKPERKEIFVEDDSAAADFYWTAAGELVELDIRAEDFMQTRLLKGICKNA